MLTTNHPSTMAYDLPAFAAKFILGTKFPENPAPPFKDHTPKTTLYSPINFLPLLTLLPDFQRVTFLDPRVYLLWVTV